MFLTRLFICIVYLSLVFAANDKKCIPVMTGNGLETLLSNKTLNNICIRVLVDQIITQPIHRFHINNLTIHGLAIVTCKSDAGISFENSDGISFSDLTFDGCGGKFDSTATPSDKNSITPYIYTVLYFNQTKNLKFFFDQNYKQFMVMLLLCMIVVVSLIFLQLRVCRW